MSDPPETPKPPPTDPRLNITSEEFDPLFALYSKTMRLPFPKATLFDNLSKIEARYKEAGTFEKRFKLKSELSTKASTSKQQDGETSNFEAPERRFLPHQMMVKGTGPRARSKRNILLKLAEPHEGPLGLLKTYMDTRTRVKIYTRKEKGVRGYITGVVEAFDKHFNIALSDCYEKWRRRKYKYSPNVQAYGTPEDMNYRIKRLGIKIPEITVKSLNRKYVECTRNVSQLMIRGEQVVLITVDQCDGKGNKKLDKK